MPLRRAGIGVLAVAVLAMSCSGPTQPTVKDTDPAVAIAFDADTCFPGESATLHLGIHYSPSGMDITDSLESFKIRILYNPELLSFLGGIEVGDVISEWEFFTYRYGQIELGNGETAAAIQIVGIRDLDDGRQPMYPQKFPEGDLVAVSFQVTSDFLYVDSTIPLRFLSAECSDNALFPYTDPNTYYLPGPTSDSSYLGPIVDTTVCLERLHLEPIVEFKSGGITIRDPRD